MEKIPGKSLKESQEEIMKNFLVKFYEKPLVEFLEDYWGIFIPGNIHGAIRVRISKKVFVEIPGETFW